MEQNFYENYYWQDDKIRFRFWLPEDAARSRPIDYDSYGLSLVEEEMQLPPEALITDGEPARRNHSAPAFVIETLDDEFIGHIHFNFINERHGTFSIGMILCPSKRRQGYGTRAMKLLLKYAFHERRLHKFDGFCCDENTASIKMMKKLGCRQEGVVREEVFMSGKYHDRILFGLTAEEFHGMGEQS